MNVQEAATFLGVKANTIRIWAQGGKLNGLKVGTRGDWRFTREELARMINISPETYAEIKHFIYENARGIQELSLKKHIQYLGKKQLRISYTRNQIARHVALIREFANNMDNVKKGTEVFGRLGEQIARDAVMHNLTLEEAVDGTIFLKQAFWEKLEEEGLLYKLTTRDLYEFSHVISTYSDIVAAKVALSYHENFKKETEHLLMDKSLAESRIRESEERYRRFLDLSIDGIWRFEVDKPIAVKLPVKKQIDLMYRHAYLAECNTAMARMYGFAKPSDIIGARLGDLLVRTVPQNIEYLTAFIRSGYKLHNTESVEKDKNGSIHHFLNNLTGEVENGMLLRAWGTQVDVTIRRKSQQELEDIRTRYKRLFESNIIGIVIAGIKGDSLGKFIDANDFFLRSFGYTRRELQTGKMRWDSITPPEFRERDENALGELYERGECTPYEKEYVTKTGRRVPIYVGIATIPGTDYCIAYILDISEQKQLERQKDDFLAIASHELKTPVTSLKAFAQVLHRRFHKAGDETSAVLLAKMDSQIDKLTGLIADLLDVTKIEAGKLQLDRSEFKFDDLVRETVEQVQRTTETHQIVIDGTTSKTIRADRDRIGQVITNFLTNAIKYSPKSSRIVVSSIANQKSLTLCVEDFGIGIPKDKVVHVFERFYRVTGKTHDTVPGMGLGLYISSEIIKRQNGQIWATSTVGKGSKFCFSLPIGQPR